MLDIKFIRENAELVAEKSKQKGYEVNVTRLLELDESRRNLQEETEKLRAQKNELSQSVSVSPSLSPEDNPPGGILPPSDDDRAKGKEVKQKIGSLEGELKPILTEYKELLSEVPNIFPEDTPLGGEEASREERKWGDAEAKDFEPIDHVTWAEKNDLLDFERGAKVAGNKFYFTKGSLVELEIAILQLGMEIAKSRGFIPMMVPHLVNSRIIDGAGFTAKSEDERQIYKIEGEDLNLIATAEIPLTGYHADEILAETDLPKLYAGYSPAYRLEAGAYGKHSKGLYRVHQFNKLELYVYCKPQDSEQQHSELLALEEELCQKLEIPYRVVRIAAGDLGAPAYKKYDVEYWSPVDKAYRELMSCSNVTDYQSRRLNIKYRSADGGTNLVHTLNATAAAMSRIPIAIIENFQTKDGQVNIPDTLQPYMNGQTTL